MLLRIGQWAGGFAFQRGVRSDAKIAALPSVHPEVEKARVGFHPSPECKDLRKSLEARDGIERIPTSTSHSKSTAYGIADVLNLRRLHFMSRITPVDFS